jgi:hypothetical protein
MEMASAIRAAPAMPVITIALVLKVRMTLMRVDQNPTCEVKNIVGFARSVFRRGN